MDILPFTSAAWHHVERGAPTEAANTALDLVPLPGAWLPEKIIPGPVLGHGRAAQAQLVEAINADGESILAVEKTFRPGRLTRLIYRAAFQAPFAYQHTRDAILACYYRRRVAAAMISATTPGVRVAMPLYVRHDRAANAWVLGSEFIRGRGIRPAPADPSMLRRAIGRLFGRSVDGRRREEIAELLKVMNALEWVFRRSGLVGAGWQVCPRALVSTANLLRTRDGYVVVDLESGMPAVAVGRYVFDGLRLGTPPLFDDVDVRRLSRWLDSRRMELMAHLGLDGYESLCEDSHRLVFHTRRWKKSEFALQRNRTSIVGRGFRRRFNRRLVETWQRSAVIDNEAADRMRSGGHALRRVIFLLGLLPGRSGRFLQRCWANKAYRARVDRFFENRTFRNRLLRVAAKRREHAWRDAGRTNLSQKFAGISVTFVVHYLLSNVTPARTHRWLTDPIRRRDLLSKLYLLCVSPHFQSACGRHTVAEMIRSWQRQGRIEATEARHLHKLLASSELEEYVRCMGMHLGLKILLPLLAPLKFGGAATSLATGNPLYFLLPLLFLPGCRTAITLWRMFHPSRRHIRYTEALLVGPLPVVGSLAYPVQMRATHPELSELLLREAASRIGRVVPIYGGKDSRVEIWAIKAVNLVLEAIDIMHAATRPFGLLFRLKSGAMRTHEELVTIPVHRLARLEARQIALLSASETSEISAADAAWAAWSNGRNAAERTRKSA